MQPNAYNWTHADWKRWMKGVGEPVFRADQVMDWLYVKRVSSFAEMTNLSRGLRERLDRDFQLKPLETITVRQSADGTIKFLFQLNDGHAIETVIMRHNYGNSVCVTTQVGCRVGCTFCASTLGGLKRNLDAGEVVAQVVEAQRYLDSWGERVHSVVIMGIGEPFENYDASVQFMRVIQDAKGLNIGQRRITVSTSGIVPSIYRFTEEGLQVGLAISLHAPNQALRKRLMPVSYRYPLEELLVACRYYVQKTRRRITYEYALIGGKNDAPEHAHELGQLLQGSGSLINLIPVNHVPERNYIRTSRNRIFKFRNILQSYNLNTTIRREHGSDIEAACGQLRAQHLGLEQQTV
ncbi:putative dual-specificity RNA methyltransferase RlmN [Kroppenstedtia guangzhouensis]|uniref:Probable dual-specificity RNA methyltransferase RlmN n=1 Tax=Kroppenstedtia guangzhouensis TaxID=1274356 RepID=A0ABQ1FZQ7_9BACL|nr:23S rRNA (adenine(2503)-C(2))-methyltransferase RlmN [Kroppenstedtia guangzhouensis]GGA33156.1 putative dual-specificity RNA methyltransferase RlmN [Kroppenstedtia guangzhouensis]